MTLYLDYLICHKNEDWTGNDECRLEVYCDGIKKAILYKGDMNEGSRWDLSYSYFKFNSSVAIKLFDEDWPDADDSLGTVTVKPVLVSEGMGHFGEDDADYDIYYSVKA